MGKFCKCIGRSFWLKFKRKQKLSNLENYAEIINCVFGNETATFDVSSNQSNSIIGALNHDQFLTFKNNYIERLKRIKKIYGNDPELLTPILVQVNEVASKKNWQGAYAELAAFDQLNKDFISDQYSLLNPIVSDVTESKTFTYADELGKQACNLDGHISDFDTYFDIKVLKDNVTEILEGIYKDVYNQLTGNNIIISAEYDLSLDYAKVAQNRRRVYDELIAHLDPTTKPKSHYCAAVPELRFKFLWGSGISMAERTKNSYEFAEKYHRILFNYTDKFVKVKPSFIVFVSFKWYNQNLSDFDNDNLKIYRSIARRVFCQYQNNNALFNTIKTSFTGPETIHEVTKKLSGIIFLEDNCISSEEKTKTNVKSFVYLNPNADNPVKATLNSYLMGLDNQVYDNFEFDNY